MLFRSIKNLIFENIAIDTDGTHFLSESLIRGFDSANNIDRVAFRGITLNGEQVTDPEMIINFGENQSAQLLDIDYETVHNIWFNGERLDHED